MGRIFKDRERIMRLFRMNNMNYTKKTYGNIRSFLETYVGIKPDIIYLPVEKGNAVLIIEAPEIFKEMIGSEIIPPDKIEKFIGGMMRSGHLQEMIDKALREVRELVLEIYNRASCECKWSRVKTGCSMGRGHCR